MIPSVSLEPWLFGDEYTLPVGHEQLTAALRAHIRILEREELSVEPVTLEDGKITVLDLLFAATIPMPTQSDEHLIVELKRPSMKLGHAELTREMRGFRGRAGRAARHAARGCLAPHAGRVTMGEGVAADPRRL